jgi:hypothetical protein
MERKNMSAFLNLLLGKKDGSVLKVIKETADELIYSKEEKAADLLEAQKASEEAMFRQQTLDNEQFNKELESTIKLIELEVEDKKSARDREISITTSTTSGALNKNIMPIIALFILLSTLIMYIILIFKRSAIVALDMTIIGSIIDTFKTLSTLIVGYYFGSSQGSRIKDLK